MNNKKLSIIYISIAIHAVFTGLLPADDFSSYNTDDVISRVMENYSRIFSAGGRIARTVEVDGVSRNISGRFTVVRPDRLFVEYIGEDHQITVNDGKTFCIYYPDENRGLHKNTRDMQPLERFVLGPEPFFGNILQLMQDEFLLDLADMVSGNLILKAKPVKPLQFNFILIAVDPETWTIKALEHFDTHNKLVSQTRYLEFRSVGDSLYFPTKTKTSTVSGDNLFVETLDLTRVQLNRIYNDETFKTPGNDETEWTIQDVGSNEKNE